MTRRLPALAAALALAVPLTLSACCVCPKTGKLMPDNLDHVFQVQLGKYTEPFHLDWLRDNCGLPIVEPAQRQHSHPEFSWMRAQLDGWIDDTFIEVKHSNERATLELMVERYLPQLAHYCMVMGGNYCWLSFIPGNQAPVYAKVNIPDGYIERLKLMEIEFWWHVTNDTAPPASIAHAAIDASGVLIDDMRTVDMTSSNSWATAAQAFIDTKAAAEANEQAKKDLKELVEPDVREAHGHGVRMKRDKRGSLRLTIDKEK